MKRECYYLLVVPLEQRQREGVARVGTGTSASLAAIVGMGSADPKQRAAPFWNSPSKPTAAPGGKAGVLRELPWYRHLQGQEEQQQSHLLFPNRT